MSSFVTKLENRANDASSLRAFSHVNLRGIKDSVSKILRLIGQNGIFGEYTRHDISHVDGLLKMLDWLVPTATFSRMTDADCLMATLAVYFHDLGMAVTRDEFERRSQSQFHQFRVEVFEGDQGKDYRDKVEKMDQEKAERFLYQEFVRIHHAERIRSWIVGKPDPTLGTAEALVAELDRVLSGLDGRFRRDLGLVCESHHKNDLQDLDKYKVSQPYGSEPGEIANLQYCAILLRTADLLHVTQDRAPSIEFRLVNPSDPKSIEEWRKQMPIVAVRAKDGIDKEGNVDKNAPRDTIEINGYFKEPEGFFALTSYLNYAGKELRRSNEWVEIARKKKGVTYEFPWRAIDETGLEAEGFIEEQFEFTLDQAKILDLLTGQTLYNDMTVVLRELLQNSLDAIRLQWEEEKAFISDGEVEIVWNTNDRLLTITDNGTGMTQRVIDAHFLKVGSSYYQNEEFRKRHPQFSAISRFGIGVLSAFMISDEIEVTTCHPDEAEARTLSLRSLHGKYLVRLIEKGSADLPKLIVPHGTRMALRVRASAELKDLHTILKRWVLFPRCRVRLVVDGASPVIIGFAESKDALQAGFAALGLEVSTSSAAAAKDFETRIEQRSKDGVTLAYPVRWSDSFREWMFSSYQSRDGAQHLPTGTCIEGIRVDSSSPGYHDSFFPSLANATGPRAPKTNVARSGFENTAERDSLLKTIYDLYCEHVTSEVTNLQKERGYSLTWALTAGTWQMDSLLPGAYRPGQAIAHNSLLEACAEVPSVALEEGGIRGGMSAKDLAAYESFWTVDSVLFSSVETLLKEIPSVVTMSSFAPGIGVELDLPPGAYIAVQRPRSVSQMLPFKDREVDKIVLRRDRRRVDLRWVKKSTRPLWQAAAPRNQNALNILTQFSQMAGQEPVIFNILIAVGEVELDGLDGDLIINSAGRTFVLPSSYSKCLIDQLDRLEKTPEPRVVANYAVAVAAATAGGPVANPTEFVQQRLSLIGRATSLGPSEISEEQNLISLLQSTTFKSFNTQTWLRGQIPF